MSLDPKDTQLASKLIQRKFALQMELEEVESALNELFNGPPRMIGLSETLSLSSFPQKKESK